jgi:hypothetical protein
MHSHPDGFPHVTRRSRSDHRTVTILPVNYAQDRVGFEDIGMRKIIAAERNRNSRGQIIVEGMVAMLLIFMGVVAGILLLAGCFIGVQYQQKINYVANVAAKFAANQPLGTADLNSPTCLVVRDLLDAAGMKTAVFHLHIETVTIGGLPGAKVVINVSGLGLVGDGTILPTAISMNGLSAAPRDAFAPNGVLFLSCRKTNNTFDGSNTSVAIPTYGRYTRTSKVLSSVNEVSSLGNAQFPRPFSDSYYLSFPNGGFNASIDSGATKYAFFDYPTNNPQSAPPADYP